MDMHYRWCFSAPAPTLYVHMQNFRHGERLFEATMALEREPIGRAALLRALASFPFMTLRVIAAIHWQALRLWLKRTPVYTHP
jgi:DUF1365 family protein